MVERTGEEDDEDDDDDSEYNSDDESDDESDDDDDTENEEVIRRREPFSNFALLGLRLFTNRLEDVEHDPQDVMADYTLTFQNLHQQPVIPTIEYITEKMVEQGVTMYQLVHTLVMDHQEYENWDEGNINYNDLSQRIRQIINEFQDKPNGRVELPEIPSQPAAIVHVSPPSSHPLCS
jgi:hypothetical protein